ncbi:MAG: hypothetical protein GKR89_34620 [Candidatus Latescibacteria bacterium]|nr:hypothetical protein [Candidatus Latescibacterota bacterium]
MTAAELYRYDVRGYMLLPEAIDKPWLQRINARIDTWQERAEEDRQQQAPGVNPEVRYDRIIEQEQELVELAAHPVVVPYLVEMIEKPRLKSTWLAFKWRGGETRLHSNHTPSVTHNFYHFNGQIRHNLLNIMYALDDIEPGGGGLQVVPGSHKANYPRPNGDNMEDMLVELPMKAGDALLFSHDMAHCSRNDSSCTRRTAMYTYCPGVIANSYGGDQLNDPIFDKAPEGSWLKYLARQPNGFMETYPQPDVP